MAENFASPKLENRNSKSFVPWRSSFPPSQENNGYQQFDRDTVEAREYQQELENRQNVSSATSPNKKPDVAVNIIELQQEHFSRSDHPQYPPLTKPSGLAIFLREWWMETSACFIVIASLCAIVGIVSYHNGQPLPDWKHGFTINSMISIFLTLMKSGMGLVVAQGLAHLKWTWFDDARPLQDLETYDAATKGPLGALMLLWTVRTRHIITAVGAIVTVAALAIDPAVQALVKYYDCAAPVNAIAAMPRAQVYEELGFHIGAGTPSVPLGLQGAISAGIFTPGALAMTYECPTGNCTFSIRSSIGYCSRCEDISDRIKLHESTERVYYDDYTDPITHLNYTTYPVTQSTLPSGLTTANTNDGPSSTYFAAQADADGGIQLLAGTAPAYILRPAGGCKSVAAAKTWACKGKGAASCQLFPCVRTFQGNVSGGSLIEEPISQVSTWDTSQASSPYSAMVDMTCVSPSQRLELAKLGYKFDNTTHFIGYKQSFDTSTGEWYPDGYDSANNPTTSKAASLIPRECVYEINGQVQNGLNDFWQTYFNGNLTSDGDWYNGPSQLEALYNDGDPSFEVVEDTFRNISLSMTTHMRQNGATKYSPATQGTVFKNVTCVRVRWEFLVFPAVIVVMMITFFVGMALDTRNRQGVQGIDHGFKSSPLALMVHGLDSDVQEKLRAPVQQPVGGEKNTIAPLRNDAKKVVVRLSPTSHGLRFVKE
jgi:hypothetical protein